MKAGKKTIKDHKYSVIFHAGAEYHKDARPSCYLISGNSLENLLRLAEKHISRKRNPWAHIQVLRNTRFNPYRESETLLFFSV